MNDDSIKSSTSPAYGAEHRKERRYTCVAVPLLYSPVSNSYAEGMGEKIYKAAVVDLSLFGLAFDVDSAMQAGDKITVIIEKPEEENNEQLAGEVCWCRELPNKQYRVGVAIEALLETVINSHEVLQFDLSGEVGVPKEVESNCPACEKRSTFYFFDFQPVLAGRGVMPLYDCSTCGTTRSLSGILR